MKIQAFFRIHQLTHLAVTGSRDYGTLMLFILLSKIYVSRVTAPMYTSTAPAIHSYELLFTNVSNTIYITFNGINLCGG